MTSIAADTKAMRQLAADLKIASEQAQKDFYVGLKAGGEIVATKARANAKSFPRKGPGTNRIADSVRVRRSGVRVKIQGGGDAAPEAAPLEHHGMPGKFRHPVGGNRQVWVDQPARPWLTPAAVEMEPAVIALIDETTFKAFSRLGF